MSEPNEKRDEANVLPDKPAASEEEADERDQPLTEEEFREQYRDLPIWKQVILWVLFLGAMVTVIMLINFVVDFGAELIKILVQK